MDTAAAPSPPAAAVARGGGDFDLVVLGAGSGGVACARRAALHGARVAIVEGSRVGGTCVIRGCVPKKLMVYAAQYADAMHEARGYGWLIDGEPRFELAHWADAKQAETARLEGVYRRLLADAGVELVEGWGRLAGAGTVQVGERRLRARHVVIATGAHPVRDSIPGIEAAAVSDDVLDLRTLPGRIAIIGAGYIALEFAGVLARLGAEVSLHYRDTLPLRGFDQALRSRVADALQSAGVSLRPGATPRRISHDGGQFVLHGAGGAGGAGEERVPFVFNATGRRPNTRRIGLDTVGLAADARGAVAVDDALRTACPGLHAIGDVTHRRNLTPVAIAEGRALADRLFGGVPPERAVDLGQVASAVFSLPPIASIGPAEHELEATGAEVDVYETDFRPMRQTFFGGTERCFMKLLVDVASDRVLAVHMVGADAPEIVQSLAVALTARATKADFDRTVAVHPTAAEEFVLMRTPARRIGGAPAA